MRDIDDLFDDDGDEPGLPDEGGAPEPDRLATDSLDALRDDELGNRDAGDPALAAVRETGGLDSEDEDLDDDDLGGGYGSPDDLFDPLDEDGWDEEGEESEEDDWDED